jgi:hypothetical protein
MITVLAVDPSFGASYNVKKALSAVDETILICTHLDKWRHRPADTIDYHLSPKTAYICADLVKESRFTFLVGGSACSVMEHLPGHRTWARELNLAAWFTDTHYRKHSKKVNTSLRSWGCKTFFALPDDVYLSNVPMGTIPLMQPISLKNLQEKAATLTIMHSPGTNTKRVQKGSDAIEEVIVRLQKEYDFTYECLVRLPHAECLTRKAKAHIFIDKLPSEASIGLGKSGLEALASRAIVLSAMYDPKFSAAYFDSSPVLRIDDSLDLEDTLRSLLDLSSQHLQMLGIRSRSWIEKYWGLENNAWLEYFREFVEL